MRSIRTIIADTRARRQVHVPVLDYPRSPQSGAGQPPLGLAARAWTVDPRGAGATRRAGLSSAHGRPTAATGRNAAAASVAGRETAR